MELTIEEQSIADGQRGPVLQFCLDLLARVGAVQGAATFAPIEAAYVNTCFATVPSHLDFMTWVQGSGAKVAVPTYTNVGGWDRAILISARATTPHPTMRRPASSCICTRKPAAR